MLLFHILSIKVLHLTYELLGLRVAVTVKSHAYAYFHTRKKHTNLLHYISNSTIYLHERDISQK